PMNISSFTFLGHAGDATIPVGYGFAYVQFHRDMNGVLYYKTRVHVHENAHAEGEYAVGLHRYSVSTGEWTELGGLAPTTHGNVAIYKSVFWEDNGQWWETQPPDHSDSFYQSSYNGLSIDRDNNLHFCFSINNITDNKDSTETIYWKSTDGGETFERADGTVISAPVRASGSADVGDIVGANGRYGGDAWAGVHWDGKPIIVYTDYTDQSSANPNSPPQTRLYQSGGTWGAAIDHPYSSSGPGSGVGDGNDYIITYWAINNSTFSGRLYRTRG
ncbi:unnamed protein product, partial [marine sediment metagenome]